MKLLKLYKPDCTPCGMVENYLKENGVIYDSVNVFEDVDTVVKYGAMGAPITILIDDEENEVSRVVGYNPPALEELINRMGE